MLENSQELLSDVTVFNKYARYVPALGRRETWEEVCQRNMEMHCRKYPAISEEIQAVYANYVVPKLVLPSMRSLQFAGMPIELSNNRIYNCAYTAMDDVACFPETMFNLLGGSGVGYSVQHRHISKLPTVVGPSKKQRRFLIGDSIEGWADAIKVLMKSYFYGKSDPAFDFRDIRPKGSLLVTSGGKAPGPDPLRICIDKLRSVLNGAVGRQLKSLEVHDMQCHIADAVLSGGIRRAALICLFDKDDMDMLTCKSGNWFALNPQRGRANNSVVLHRDETTYDEFEYLWERIHDSKAGEPGIFWTNDYDWGTNPCAEIALMSNSYCNLTEINGSTVTGQQDLNDRAMAAAFLGTLQAGYTNFHYLRPIWQANSERMALLGIGITGIASGNLDKLDLGLAAKRALDINAYYALKLSINPAHRVTCVKPSGTSSMVLGCSSGIHAWHAPFYIRRVRVGKNEALYSYLLKNLPNMIEDSVEKPHLEAVVSFPQKAPAGAILRDENVIELLERVARFNTEWVRAGHVIGNNTHNVSCTISVKDSEWDAVKEWMWNNKDFYTGISVLPYDGGTYVQAPFEEVSEETFNTLSSYFKELDIKDVRELDDNTTLNDQVACIGGACEI